MCVICKSLLLLFLLVWWDSWQAKDCFLCGISSPLRKYGRKAWANWWGSWRGHRDARPRWAELLAIRLWQLRDAWCVASGMSHNVKCTVVSRLSNKSASLLRGLRKSGRDGWLSRTEPRDCFLGWMWEALKKPHFLTWNVMHSVLQHVAVSRGQRQPLLVLRWHY
jgi:hypothetical protein